MSSSLRPIAHIGFHKTATSWFQRRVYPGVHTHRLVDRRTVRRVLLGGDPFGFDPIAARVALGVGAGRPAILCEEDLSGVMHNGVISNYVAREAAQRLHATVPDARVVIFVRAQPAMALSWYLQYLREGGTGSIHRYLFPEGYRHLGHDRPFKMPRFSFGQIDYRGLIETYDALFGRDAVIVLPYEDLAQDRPGLLERMGQMLEVTLPDPGGGRVNAGYRRGLLPVARVANLFTRRSVVDKATLVHIPYWYTVRKALLERLNRVPLFGRPPRADTMLDGRTCDWIAQRFWESNRWLEQRMARELRPLGYPLDPPDAPVTPPARALAWIAN